MSPKTFLWMCWLFLCCYVTCVRLYLRACSSWPLWQLRSLVVEMHHPRTSSIVLGPKDFLFRSHLVERGQLVAGTNSIAASGTNWSAIQPVHRLPPPPPPLRHHQRNIMLLSRKQPRLTMLLLNRALLLLNRPLFLLRPPSEPYWLPMLRPVVLCHPSE